MMSLTRLRQAWCLLPSMTSMTSIFCTVRGLMQAAMVGVVSADTSGSITVSSLP